jgi:putative aldouronate transport system permease protein
LTLGDIAKVVRNTVVIALGKIVIGTFLAIAFAILLNEIHNKFFKKGRL